MHKKCVQKRIFNPINLPVNIPSNLISIKEAQVAETLAIIPESQREAFKEYANDDLSLFTIDEIADGIYRHNQGESLEDIKKDISTKDWGGVNEEDNRARGVKVYNKMIGFLEIDK